MIKCASNPGRKINGWFTFVAQLDITGQVKVAAYSPSLLHDSPLCCLSSNWCVCDSRGENPLSVVACSVCRFLLVVSIHWLRYPCTDSLVLCSFPGYGYTIYSFVLKPWLLVASCCEPTSHLWPKWPKLTRHQNPSSVQNNAITPNLVVSVVLLRQMPFWGGDKHFGVGCVHIHRLMHLDLCPSSIYWNLRWLVLNHLSHFLPYQTAPVDMFFLGPWDGGDSRMELLTLCHLVSLISPDWEARLQPASSSLRIVRSSGSYAYLMAFLLWSNHLGKL